MGGRSGPQTFATKEAARRFGNKETLWGDFAPNGGGLPPVREAPSYTPFTPQFYTFDVGGLLNQLISFLPKWTPVQTPYNAPVYNAPSYQISPSIGSGGVPGGYMRPPMFPNVFGYTGNPNAPLPYINKYYRNPDYPAYVSSVYAPGSYWASRLPPQQPPPPPPVFSYL